MKRKFLMTAIVACLGLLCFCACGDSKGDSALSVTLNADVQMDGAFVRSPGEITVLADAAENSGFTDGIAPETAVSALDVMVALHEELYGEEFTADPASFLAIDGGWISHAFDNSTDSVSVILNGESAHSETVSSYGGFEALTVDQTEVKNGDTIEFVAYQDTENYGDYALWLFDGDEKVTSLETTVGSEVKLTVKGYAFSFYGAYGTEEISASYLEPVAGAALALVDEDGTLVPVGDGVADGEGNLSFIPEEVGTYTLAAYLPEDQDAKAFISWITVTVK